MSGSFLSAQLYVVPLGKLWAFLIASSASVGPNLVFLLTVVSPPSGLYLSASPFILTVTGTSSAVVSLYVTITFGLIDPGLLVSGVPDQE